MPARLGLGLDPNPNPNPNPNRHPTPHPHPNPYPNPNPNQLGAYALSPRTRAAAHFSARLHVFLGSAVGDTDSTGDGGEG